MTVDELLEAPVDPDCFFCGRRVGTDHLGYPGHNGKYRLCAACDALLESHGL